ncbi:MAG: hypothetical protein WD907_05010, partial [Bacilli bacterium]
QQFNIKYGLFQELKRKSQFREQVLSSLSEFIAEFNAETSRKMEVKGKEFKGRSLVSASAIEKFIQLYDLYPKSHEVIVLLLIAYASSFDDSYKTKSEAGNE